MAARGGGSGAHEADDEGAVYSEDVQEPENALEAPTVAEGAVIGLTLGVLVGSLTLLVPGGPLAHGGMLVGSILLGTGLGTVAAKNSQDAAEMRKQKLDALIMKLEDLQAKVSIAEAKADKASKKVRDAVARARRAEADAEDPKADAKAERELGTLAARAAKAEAKVRRELEALEARLERARLRLHEAEAAARSDEPTKTGLKRRS
jgi:hypothetical protein